MQYHRQEIDQNRKFLSCRYKIYKERLPTWKSLQRRQNHPARHPAHTFHNRISLLRAEICRRSLTLPTTHTRSLRYAWKPSITAQMPFLNATLYSYFKSAEESVSCFKSPSLSRIFFRLTLPDLPSALPMCLEMPSDAVKSCQRRNENYFLNALGNLS